MVLDFGQQKLHNMGVGTVQEPLEELAAGLIDGQLIDAPFESLQLGLLAPSLLILAHNADKHLFTSVH